MTAEPSVDWSGLYPTKVRCKLLLAVRDAPGRIYYEPSAKQAHDALTGRAVTAALSEQVDAGWLRPRRPTDAVLDGEWSHTRIYYRITPLGERAIERGRR